MTYSRIVAPDVNHLCYNMEEGVSNVHTTRQGTPTEGRILGKVDVGAISIEQELITDMSRELFILFFLNFLSLPIQSSIKPEFKAGLLLQRGN